MGLILDISPRTLEKVLYFASYIVLDGGNTSLQYKQVLSEKEYREEVEKYGSKAFRVGMGAEAILELLQAIDLEKDSAELRKALKAVSYTHLDVYKRQAQSSLLSTQSQLESLKNTAAGLKTQLGLLTGWSADSCLLYTSRCV